MNIIVIGSGGREHTVIKKLAQSPEITKIYALPGNGGIAADAECVNIGATDIDGIVDFAKDHDIGYAVVTPDDPLALGAVDRLNEIAEYIVRTYGLEYGKVSKYAAAMALGEQNEQE